MNNFETQYTVVGSSALSLQPNKTIIEFPKNNNELPTDEQGSHHHSSKIACILAKKFAESPFIQDLAYGSLQGKSFNKAKSWHAVLACGGFLAVALAFIYIGR